MNLDTSEMGQYRRSKLKPFEQNRDPEAPPSILEIRERYCWNTHIMQVVNKGLMAQEFILPLVCGYFESRVVEVKDKIFHVGILSRR